MKDDLTKYGFPEVATTLNMPKEAIFTVTDKPISTTLSGRNRRMLTILKLEGSHNVIQLAKRLGLNESTVLKELRYMENLGLVHEVGFGAKTVSDYKKKEKVKKIGKEVGEKKGDLDKYIAIT